MKTTQILLAIIIALSAVYVLKPDNVSDNSGIASQSRGE